VERWRGARVMSRGVVRWMRPCAASRQGAAAVESCAGWGGRTLGEGRLWTCCAPAMFVLPCQPALRDARRRAEWARASAGRRRQPKSSLGRFAVGGSRRARRRRRRRERERERAEGRGREARRRRRRRRQAVGRLGDCALAEGFAAASAASWQWRGHGTRGAGQASRSRHRCSRLRSTVVWVRVYVYVYVRIFVYMCVCAEDERTGSAEGCRLLVQLPSDHRWDEWMGGWQAGSCPLPANMEGDCARQPSHPSQGLGLTRASHSRTDMQSAAVQRTMNASVAPAYVGTCAALTIDEDRPMIRCLAHLYPPLPTSARPRPARACGYRHHPSTTDGCLGPCKPTHET
jgi:hypothetical protein